MQKKHRSGRTRIKRTPERKPAAAWYQSAPKEYTRTVIGRRGQINTETIRVAVPKPGKLHRSQVPIWQTINRRLKNADLVGLDEFAKQMVSLGAGPVQTANAIAIETGATIAAPLLARWYPELRSKRLTSVD